MSNWNTKKIGDIAVIRRGGSPRPIQDYLVSYDSKGYNWLKIGDVSIGSRYVFKTGAKIKPEGLKKTTLVKKGDFILSNSMSFGRPYIMMTDACIHDGWLALQDISKDIDKQFLYYLLTSEKMQNEFKNYSAGSGVQNLKKETVQRIEFKSPDRPEQERIATVLRVWDEYLEKLKQKIALKEVLRKGLSQQLLTGASRLPGQNSAWHTTTIDSIANVLMGQSPSSSSYNTKGDGIVLIQGSADMKEGSTVERIWTTEVTKMAQKNSLIMTVRAPVGEIATSTQEVCLGRGVCVISSDFSEYLRIYLGWFKPRWLQYIQGSTFESINGSDIRNLKLTIPDIEEANAIVRVITSIDSDIALTKAIFNAISLQKKYLLKNLIAGTIRTPETLTKKELA